MTISSPLIAAVAVPVSGSMKQDCAGRVERQIDQATFSIRVGADTIAVRVTDGALSVGQRVNVLVRNNMLVIEPVGPQAAGAGPLSVEDSFLKSSGISTKTIAAGISAIVADLTSKPDDGQTVRQCETLFAALRPGCSAIDHNLTKDIAGLLGPLAEAPDAATDTAENTAEVIRLLERLKQVIQQVSVAAVPTSDRTIATQQPVPEGVYSFSKVEDALAFLGIDPQSDEALARELERRLDDSGVIIIRTSAAADGGSLATLLGPEELRTDLEALPSTFDSRAFRSIPAAVFEQLLNDRNMIDIEHLRSLDALAVDQQLPALTAKAGSNEAREAALQQWLSAATGTRPPSAALVSLLPVFSASSMIDAIDELSTSGNRLLPSAEDLLPTSDDIAGPSEKGTFFDRAFNKLGFALEQTLIGGGAPEKTSLKARLLALAEEIGTPQWTPAGSGAADTLSQQSVDEGGGGIVSGLKDFEQEVLLLVNKPFMANAPVAGGTPSQGAVHELNNLYDAFRQDLRVMVQTSAGELKKQIALITSSVPKTDADEQTFPGPGDAAEAKTADPETALSPRNEAADRITALLRLLASGLETRVQELLQQTYDSEKFPALQDFRASLNDTAAACVRAVDNFHSSIFRAIEAAARDSVPGGTDGARHGPTQEEQNLPSGKAPGDGDDASLLRATLRQQVDALLNRVESFQLLARTTATAAGDQQIVALPIKIGGEWTEMQVRFIRRRAGKTGARNRGHYTVYLNVAPSFLGVIDARLEYQQKKNFSLALTFESDATRQWFSARKTGFRKTLVSLGLPSPHIELFAAKRVSAEKSATTSAPRSASTIDLKV